MRSARADRTGPPTASPWRARSGPAPRRSPRTRSIRRGAGWPRATCGGPSCSSRRPSGGLKPRAAPRSAGSWPPLPRPVTASRPACSWSASTATGGQRRTGPGRPVSPSAPSGPCAARSASWACRMRSAASTSLRDWPMSWPWRPACPGPLTGWPGRGPCVGRPGRAGRHRGCRRPGGPRRRARRGVVDRACRRGCRPRRGGRAISAPGRCGRRVLRRRPGARRPATHTSQQSTVVIMSARLVVITPLWRDEASLREYTDEEVSRFLEEDRLSPEACQGPQS